LNFDAHYPNCVSDSVLRRKPQRRRDAKQKHLKKGTAFDNVQYGLNE